MYNVLQCNLARSWPAQQLLGQHIFELDIAICAVSEPRTIPENPFWFGSQNQLAAIHWRETKEVRTCSLVYRAQDFVVVRHGSINVIASYISPNCDNEEFLTFLDNLGVALRILGGRTLICGDFNSKYSQWGSPHTNRRGELVCEWAAEHDLRLANSGNDPTCVRPQGWSIRNLTWTTADIGSYIHGWKVLNNIESLSDHQYIAMSVGQSTIQGGATRVKKDRFRHPRWNWAKMDEEMFYAAIDWNVADPLEEGVSAEHMAKWMKRVIHNASDAATTRVKGKPARRQFYWWKSEIEALRRISLSTQRAWSRAKVRRDPEEHTNQLWREHKLARRKLRLEINKAKQTAWQELLDTIESDPWGMPYKVVLKKLRTAASSLVETLDKEVLDLLIESLFPLSSEVDPTNLWQEWDWKEEWEVIYHEVARIIKEKAGNNTAPGPDGIKAKIIGKLPKDMVVRFAACFNQCFKEGSFPRDWKKAVLVLIPKGDGNIEDELPKVRPICLLDEMGKLLERIIAQRLNMWMDENSDF